MKSSLKILLGLLNIFLMLMSFALGLIFNGLSSNILLISLIFLTLTFLVFASAFIVMMGIDFGYIDGMMWVLDKIDKFTNNKIERRSKK